MKICFMATSKDVQAAIVLVLLVCSTQFALSEALQVYGLRIINSTIEDTGPDHLPSFQAQTDTAIYLFGTGFNNQTEPDIVIAFTNTALVKGSSCGLLQRTEAFNVKVLDENVGHAVINLDTSGTLYLCIRSVNQTEYIHQGSEPMVTVKCELESVLLPLPLQIVFIALLLVLSGLFSGLNLGLMSLDPMELQIIMSSGTESEQSCAKRIYPVRRKGNFLLCTLLLGNVLVNSSLTTLLSMLTNGLWAVIGSTAGIVVLGEILPQAVCSRYGLLVGAYTIVLTKIFMVITFVLSWPISKLLDIILGKEIGTVYNRTKLIEMLKIHDPYNDLKKDEVNIIQGALELRSKTVEEVMTPLESCYMIHISSCLDFETMREIMQTGYTRIPVYDGEDRSNIVSILFVKDLAFVDPDDAMPLRTVCSFYQHSVNYVFSDITLDQLLEKFKNGAFHMAIVQRVNNEGPGDPFYEVLGIITMEDVIEEIIKAEIVDETDVYIDNRSKTKNNMRQAIPLDLTLFSEPSEGKKQPLITPQLTYAALRYLRAEVEPFKLISEKVLLRLLKHDVVVELEQREYERNPDKRFIYTRAKPSDYFVLILEGSVQVKVGQEHLEFVSGPFSYYGVTSLLNAGIRARSNSNSSASTALGPNWPSTISGSKEMLADVHVPFKPDFSLVALDDVKYVKVTRKQYENAVKTTQMAEISVNPNPSAGNSSLLNETLDDAPSPPSTGPLSSPYNETAVKAIDEEDDGGDSDCSKSLTTLNPPAYNSSAAPVASGNPAKADNRRHLHLRDQVKSMSSDQLRALVHTYSKVAGDRLRPTAALVKTGSYTTTTTGNNDQRSRETLIEEEDQTGDSAVVGESLTPSSERKVDEVEMSLLSSKSTNNNNNGTNYALQDDTSTTSTNQTAEEGEVTSSSMFIV